MAYHGIQVPLDRALAEYGRKFPDGGEMLEKLRDLGTKQSHMGILEYDFHSALCLLVSGHVSTATERIARERHIQEVNARRMVERVLDPLATLLGRDEMLLHGALPIGDRYYVAKPEHDARTGFDRQRRMVYEAYVPIMEAALASVYERRFQSEHRISPKQSLYILALLLPAGAEKQARINALSVSEGAPNHAKLFFEAADLVHGLAQGMNIVVNKGDLAKGITDVESAISAIRKEFAGSKKNVRSPVRNDNRDPLFLSLKSMIESERITKTDAQIYYALNGPKEVAEPVTVIERLCAKYNISEEGIDEICQEVAMVLEEQGLFTADQEPSTARRPSRAARP